MERVKQFFGIEMPYRFEWNDIRASITLLNVILIIIFGLSVSWFGLAVAIFGICKDFSQHRHINDVLMHFANIILNIHFLLMLHGGK